jgi:hypothetical protein
VPALACVKSQTTVEPAGPAAQSLAVLHFEPGAAEPVLDDVAESHAAEVVDGDATHQFGSVADALLIASMQACPFCAS